MTKSQRFLLATMLIFMIGLAMCLMSCGGSKTTERVVTTPPSGNVGNGGELSFDADIKPILDENCALSGCHANAPFLASKDDFINSKGPQRITNSSMPPSYSPKYGQWTQDDKNSILAWFDANF